MENFFLSTFIFALCNRRLLENSGGKSDGQFALSARSQAPFRSEEATALLLSLGQAGRQGFPSGPISFHRKAGECYEQQVVGLQRFHPDCDSCRDLGNQSQLGNLHSYLHQKMISSALFTNSISFRKVCDHLKHCYFTNTHGQAFLTFSLSTLSETAKTK